MITPEKAKEYAKITERAKYSNTVKVLSNKQWEIYKNLKKEQKQPDQSDAVNDKKYNLKNGTMIRLKIAPIMKLKNKVGVLVFENKKKKKTPRDNNTLCVIYWNFENHALYPNEEYLFYNKLIEYLDHGIFEIVFE